MIPLNLKAIMTSIDDQAPVRISIRESSNLIAASISRIWMSLEIKIDIVEHVPIFLPIHPTEQLHAQGREITGGNKFPDLVMKVFLEFRELNVRRVFLINQLN